MEGEGKEEGKGELSLSTQATESRGEIHAHACTTKPASTIPPEAAQFH